MQRKGVGVGFEVDKLIFALGPCSAIKSCLQRLSSREFQFNEFNKNLHKLTDIVASVTTSTAAAVVATLY